MVLVQSQDYIFEDLQERCTTTSHAVDGFRFSAALNDKIRLQLNVNEVTCF